MISGRALNTPLVCSLRENTVDKSNRKRKKQLRMAFGTACSRLRKAIMFNLVQQLRLDICHRCSKKIKRVDDFSVDHKIPWLDSKNPTDLFFDVKNIAFSHGRCNISVARKTRKKYFTKEDKQNARRKQTAAYMRRVYTVARRQQKYRKTGW